MIIQYSTIRLEDKEGNEMVITKTAEGFAVRMNEGDSEFLFESHNAENITEAIDKVVESFEY